jgi:dienelactone hydrolase
MKKLLYGAFAFFLLAPALFSQSRPALTAYSLKSLQTYPFRPSSININELAFKNDLQYAYNISYTSMELSVSGRLSVPAIPPENLKGIILMLRGHQRPAGYYTGKGTEYPARSYLQRGWAVIAPDFLGYAASSPAPAPAELHQFYSTLNAVELYLSLQSPDFRYSAAIARENRAVLPSSFKKIVLWGHSNGGQAAIQTLEVLRRPVPTVLWAPVCIDFPGSMVNYQKDRKDWAEAFKRDYPAEDFALLSFLDSIAPGTPILLEQGTNDTAVPKSWSDAFARAVQEENTRREKDKTGKIALRYEVYDRADHNLSPYWNRVLPGDAAFWSEQ